MQYIGTLDEHGIYLEYESSLNRKKVPILKDK